ncbi:MAG: hypothetical protein QOD48_2371, partial [Gaiellaceae bacterium]|nr:hypothetical protein [Gaiellaceae bacterium]
RSDLRTLSVLPQLTVVVIWILPLATLVCPSE